MKSRLILSFLRLRLLYKIGSCICLAITLLIKILLTENGVDRWTTCWMIWQTKWVLQVNKFLRKRKRNRSQAKISVSDRWRRSRLQLFKSAVLNLCRRSRLQQFKSVVLNPITYAYPVPNLYHTGQGSIL